MKKVFKIEDKLTSCFHILLSSSCHNPGGVYSVDIKKLYKNP